MRRRPRRHALAWTVALVAIMPSCTSSPRSARPVASTAAPDPDPAPDPVRDDGSRFLRPAPLGAIGIETSPFGSPSRRAVAPPSTAVLRDEPAGATSAAPSAPVFVPFPAPAGLTEDDGTPAPPASSDDLGRPPTLPPPAVRTPASGGNPRRGVR